MASIIWVHGDSLSPQNPALLAYPQAPAIWVWDEQLLKESRISLKRITFIYECLLELPITIRRGDVVEELRSFAREKGAEQLVTTDSPSPRFDKICDQLESFIEIEVLEVQPFLNYEKYIDLKRFSRYWRVAQDYVFSPSAKP